MVFHFLFLFISFSFTIFFLCRPIINPWLRQVQLWLYPLTPPSWFLMQSIFADRVQYTRESVALAHYLMRSIIDVILTLWAEQIGQFSKLRARKRHVAFRTERVLFVYLRPRLCLLMNSMTRSSGKASQSLSLSLPCLYPLGLIKTKQHNGRTAPHFNWFGWIFSTRSKMEFIICIWENTYLFSWTK